MDLHDRIAKELLNQKSLAALMYLLEKGRELECFYQDKHLFLSRYGSKNTCSLCIDGKEEESFDGAEELVEKARIDGKPFLETWDEIKLSTLF